MPIILKGFGYKTLKPVEIDPEVSHEHEFNGIDQFKGLFGSRQTKAAMPGNLFI